MKLNIESPKPSAWNDDIWVGDPDGMRKLTSITILMDPDAIAYERQTYSLLDWLGDIGGLLDAFRLIGAFLVGPVASYALQAKLASRIFTKHKHKKKPLKSRQ